MSRLRENPEKLFEVFLEVGRPNSENEEPFILQKYPPDYNVEDTLKSVPKFAFPCDTERTTVDHFTFTLTDMDSKFKFGFCRHSTGAQTCFCIISFLPWFEVFYNFLNTLAEVTNRTDDCDITNMLRAAYALDVPSSGVPVTVVVGHEMFSFKAPETNKLPSIPHSRNLTEYYNAIDTENMMIIFASMLHERRILVTSKKLSRLTAVVYAASNLLYPMFWQHLFIPVLPSFLIDYLTAPMPYVIGVHTKLLEKVKTEDLGDAVIIDADQNTVVTEHDDFHDLPEDMTHYLRRHLKSEKVKHSMQGDGDIISKSFMMSLVKLIGGYRDALMFHEGERITFNPEAFVQTRPASMQLFLQKMLHLQIFQQFINDRLDMLNDFRGFEDIFEKECLLHADKLNAKTRYDEWLSKMKKQGKKIQRGGKDVWSDFKDKASPYMKEARGMMGIMAHQVKTQGKKAYSKARKQFNDLKKPPRPGVPPPTVHVTAERSRPVTVPRPVARKTSIDRATKLPPHLEVEKRVSSDDTDLVINRVSVNLLADPDIQNVMFKSASAENLPKTDPRLKASDSSGTLTSTSSFENETERASILFMDDDEHDGSRSKGDNFGINYTNLLNDDDDSGIVMRTDSVQSLDRQKVDSSGKMESGPGASLTSSVLHVSKSDSKLPPPRPAPRRNASPQLPAKSSHELGTSRERPVPLPRKSSLETSLPKSCGDALIDFSNKVEEKSSLASEFDDLNIHSAGDYVLLHESATPNTLIGNEGGNRRSSISRTPAIKLGQNETPKRPSIRRERSPVTPDESPEKIGSLLDFDPLLDSSASQSQPDELQSSDKVTSNHGDSLLKDWDIGGLANLTKSTSQNMPASQPSFASYSHSMSAARHQTMHPHTQSQFFSPQPFIPGAPHTISHVGFQNTVAHSGKERPSLPPKPNLGPGTLQPSAKKTLFQTSFPLDTENKPDPFAGLLNLKQSSSQQTTQQQTASNWETFE